MRIRFIAPATTFASVVLFAAACGEGGPAGLSTEPAITAATATQQGGAIPAGVVPDTLQLGASERFEVPTDEMPAPDDAVTGDRFSRTRRAVRWTSSDRKVLAVTAEGVASAVGAGVARVDGSNGGDVAHTRWVVVPTARAAAATPTAPAASKPQPGAPGESGGTGDVTTTARKNPSEPAPA
ncbi:MAG: hypothetical protein AVDCRST_MAG40-1325, partial [uncultured Gemmatimonadaceae bacterium]